jgi:hypothetical protein
MSNVARFEFDNCARRVSFQGKYPTGTNYLCPFLWFNCSPHIKLLKLVEFGLCCLAPLDDVLAGKCMVYISRDRNVGPDGEGLDRKVLGCCNLIGVFLSKDEVVELKREGLGNCVKA